MPTNAYMFLVAGLIPMIVGAIYYNPKVAGGAWMKINGFTEESLKTGNMVAILIVSYVFAVLIAFFMTSVVIHQSAVWSMMAPDIMEEGSIAQEEFRNLMAKYGGYHRSFSHGAIHGLFVALFFALPLLGTVALFERRGWKYILIHFGYWLITLILVGGLLCGTLQYEL